MLSWHTWYLLVLIFSNAILLSKINFCYIWRWYSIVLYSQGLATFLRLAFMASFYTCTNIFASNKLSFWAAMLIYNLIYRNVICSDRMWTTESLDMIWYQYWLPLSHLSISVSAGAWMVNNCMLLYILYFTIIDFV